MPRTKTTEQYERGTRKWWKSFGKVYDPKDKISFASDGIVIINDPEIRRKLDSRYIWIERVLTSGLTKNKRSWLKEMLSYEWLIVVLGKRKWKPGWEAIRPETYDREPPEDELKDGIYDLLQYIKWRNTTFFKEKYAALKESPYY